MVGPSLALPALLNRRLSRLIGTQASAEEVHGLLHKVRITPATVTWIRGRVGSCKVFITDPDTPAGSILNHAALAVG
jgi:hypothetical protein